MKPTPLVMVLAGGQGERLSPLTEVRSKPAVPFAGSYRIIDFTLSNCINSGLFQVFLLTQYKSLSLSRHLREGWSFLSPELGQFIQSVPPQLRIGKRWYEGTAHAVYQNVYLLEEEPPRDVLVLSGDHAYRMDYGPLLDLHHERKADVTIATFPVPPEEARRMGVIQVDEKGRVQEFVEKPDAPEPAPGMDGLCLGNMGVYAFRTGTLIDAVTEDAAKETSHDFGKDVLPALLAGGARIFSHPLPPAPGEAAPFWMDIGTLDAYFEASMGLLSSSQTFPLHNAAWPLRPRLAAEPPTIVGDAEIADSLLSPGARILGGRVERAVLSPGVVVEAGAVVRDAVLMDEVHVGAGAEIRRTVVDKRVHVPAGYRLGGEEADEGGPFTVSEDGITVVAKGQVLSS